jgi:GGDEF domain-containing protein
VGGHNRFASATVNYTLGGRRLDILLLGTVLPGREATWRRVLLAIYALSGKAVDVHMQFSVLPGYASDERAATQLAERVELLTDLNNQFYQGARMSLAIGTATCVQGGRVEHAMSQADSRMYEMQKEHYASLAHDRRR